MTNEAVFQDYYLTEEQELRFRVKPFSEDGVCIKLKHGTAEVFGGELVMEKCYEFKARASVAVFTWFGCVISIKGETDVLYVAEGTPMVIYSNIHVAFESMRGEAEIYNRRGPVVMVVGPKNVGKLTVSKILVNYSLRMGRNPTFVDLNIEEGHLCIPGSIGAMLVESPLIEDRHRPNAVVYHYGHTSSSSNPSLLTLLIQQLARKVRARLRADRKARYSGIIINTCGWTRKGHEHLLSTAKEFEVDVVLVLDEERLYKELLRDMPQSTTVVLLPKSEGVVERSEIVRSETAYHRIREYFYGPRKKSVHPPVFTLKFSQVKIFRIEGFLPSESCLPTGMKTDDQGNFLVQLAPDPSLQYRILTIIFAENKCNLISSSVAGFVYVTKVDVSRQTMTLLLPCGRSLPNDLLVLSELQFMVI